MENDITCVKYLVTDAKNIIVTISNSNEDVAF